MSTLPTGLSVSGCSFSFNFAFVFTNNFIPVFFWPFIEYRQAMLVFYWGNVCIKIEVFLTKSKGIIVQEFMISFLNKLIGLFFLFTLCKAILLLKNIWNSLYCNHASCFSQFAKRRHLSLAKSHCTC